LVIKKRLQKRKENIMIVSKISEGVNISVETFYQAEYSNPAGSEYMFAYRITIENHNSFPIKLESRHWHIFDSDSTEREVVGDGVIGVQPIINPDSTYQYVSGCNLKTEMGTMHGTYTFQNLHNKKTFTAIIPHFNMVVPFKLN
jgi:ApaG protein